jgi:gamma-tubulin complex component 2
MSEKRTERTVITTKEKAVRRNPPKEFNVANVSDWERPKSKKTVQPDGASPGAKKREHDALNGQSSYTTCVASR